MSTITELGVPLIGIEYEIVLEKNGEAVYNEDEVYDIVRDLRDLGFCVDFESGRGNYPPRIEIRLCRPVKEIDQIVDYFRRAIEEIKKRGYVPRLERWGEASGSIHVTLDEPARFEVDTVNFTPSLYLLTDNFSSKYLASRVGTFWSISPACEISFSERYLVEKGNTTTLSADNENKLVLNIEPRTRLAKILAEIAKNGDLLVEIEDYSP